MLPMKGLLLCLLLSLVPVSAGPCRQRINEVNCNVLMKALVADRGYDEIAQLASCFNFCAGQLVSTAPFFIGTSRCNGRLGSLPYVAGCTLVDLEQQVDPSPAMQDFTVVTPNEASDNSVPVTFNEPGDAPNADTASFGSSGDSDSSSSPVVTFTTAGAPPGDPVSSFEEDPDTSSPPQVWFGNIDGSPHAETNTNDSSSSPPVVTFVSELGRDDSPNEGGGSLPMTEDEGGEAVPPYQPGELVLTTNIPGATYTSGQSGSQPSPSPAGAEGLDEETSQPTIQFSFDSDDNSTLPSDELPALSDDGVDTSVQSNSTLLDGTDIGVTNSSATATEASEDESSPIEVLRNDDPRDMPDSSTQLRVCSMLTSAMPIILGWVFV